MKDARFPAVTWQCLNNDRSMDRMSKAKLECRGWLLRRPTGMQ